MATIQPFRDISQINERVQSILASNKAKKSRTPRTQATPGHDSGRTEQVIWNEINPRLDEFRRAFPNHLARSGVFAGSRRKKDSKQLDSIVLASRSDVKIIYHGPQLYEFHRDVLMQLIFEQRTIPLGERIHINRADFLRKLGVDELGGCSYEDLHDAMVDLCKALLNIETKKYKLPSGAGACNDWMHFVAKFSYDQVSGDYYARLEPEIFRMFDYQEYAFIDWSIRKKLGKHGGRAHMAKWLQCLIATSRDPNQTYSISDLKAWMVYTGRERDFINALSIALRKLESLGVIAAPRLKTGKNGQELAAWNRLI